MVEHVDLLLMGSASSLPPDATGSAVADGEASSAASASGGVPPIAHLGRNHTPGRENRRNAASDFGSNLHRAPDGCGSSSKWEDGVTGWQGKSGGTGRPGSGTTSLLLRRRPSHEVYQEKQVLDRRASRSRTHKSIGQNDDLDAFLPPGEQQADGGRAGTTRRSAKQRLPPKAGCPAHSLRTEEGPPSKV